MNLSTSRILLPILLVVLLPVVACGGGAADESNVAPADGSATPAAAASTTAEPKPWDPYCGDAPCPCKEGTERKNFRDETKLMGCELSAATTIQSIPCATKEVRFADNGRLIECRLAEAFEISGISCKESTIRFHANGYLDQCWFDGQQKIANLDCQHSAIFFDDGTFRRCQLASDHTFGDLQVPAGDWAWLNEDGGLRRWEMSGERTVGDLQCSGSMNFFHDNGQLAKCDLTKAASVGGQSFAAGDSVCFDEGGAVADCKILQFEAT